MRAEIEKYSLYGGLLFFCLTTSLPAERSILPQIVLGGGWTTTVILINDSYEPSTLVQITVHDGDDALYAAPHCLLLNGKQSSGELELFLAPALPPGRDAEPEAVNSAVLVFGCDQEFPTGGWIVIEASESISITAYFDGRDVRGNVYETVAVRPFSSNRESVIIPVLLESSTDTGLALVPHLSAEWPPGRILTYYYMLYDESGREIHFDSIEVIGQQSLFISELVPLLERPFRGHLLLLTGMRYPVSVMGMLLRSRPDGFQLTSVPPRLSLR